MTNRLADGEGVRIPDGTRQLSVAAGLLYLAFGASLHALHTNVALVPGPTMIVQNTFGVVLLVVSLLANFGIGFGVVWLYREHDLVLPGAIVVGIGLWAVGLTIVEWPRVVLRGHAGFEPLSLRPVPYLGKWIPVAGVAFGGGVLEVIVRNGRSWWENRSNNRR